MKIKDHNFEYNLREQANPFNLILDRVARLTYEYDLIKFHHRLYNMYPSYLGPAYHFNRYSIVEKELEFDMMETTKKGYVDEKDLNFDGIKIHLELNAFILALHAALDRLVFFIRLTYEVKDERLGFGGIDSKNKPYGMMKKVIELKQNDNLMKLIFDNFDNFE